MSKEKQIKNINYLGRDFSDLEKNLQTFIKSYFPNQYQDFSESSPGQMMIQLAAYVGDVLGFNMDKNLQEFFSGNPKQRRSVIQLAKRLGYKPKASVSAQTKLDLYITVPSTGSVGNKVPDTNYCPIIKKGSQFRSNTNPSVIFELIRDVNFNVNLGTDNLDITIAEKDPSGFPTKFLLRKKIDVISGETKEFDQIVNNPEKYLSIELPSDTVSEIVEIKDADDNIWYEVDSLAQDTIFYEEDNNVDNDPESADDSTTVPYNIKLKRVPKRFTVTMNEDNLTYVNFGSGVNNSNDEELIPNPKNVGAPIINSADRLDYAVDPENFLQTKTFGEAPSNTTLTIKYREGGGLKTNVPANTITSVINAEYVFPVNESSLDNAKISDLKSSISCDNPTPATGGRDAQSNKEIAEMAFAELKTQKRCVTKEDYIVRAYSLPARFGNIAKVYLEKDDAVRSVTQSDIKKLEERENLLLNPFALNLYILAYNNNHNLINASTALKKNLKNYISQYRLLTDTINILDGNIINIKVNFEVIVTKSKNKNDVLIECIEKLKDYFYIDNWNFNQPIIYSDITKILTDVDGVKSIPLDYNRNSNERKGIWIECQTGGNYSNTSVDIEALTKDGIIYSPKEISIFEVKFPDSDIIGRAI